MFGALLYLRLTSLRNTMLSRVRRLKQPKYLVGAIVGAGYFYLMFFRRLAAGRPSVHDQGYHGPVTVPPELLSTLLALGALILLVIVTLGWILPDQRAGLTFSEAEIAFLFPAPVRRRTLIWYKLINSQIAIMFTAAIITLVTGSWGFLGGSALTHGIGWWFILATLNLHFMGASFAMTRLMDNGITPWRRRSAVLGLVALVALVTLAWLWRDLRAPAAADLESYRTAAAYLNTLLTSGPLPWLLRPAEFVVGPFFAPDTPAFLTALGPALLVFALHYVWVLRSEVSFEDASIAKSEKRAAKIAAVREGNWRAASGAIKARAPAFRLASTGRPEIAFLWKNLLSTFPLFRLGTLVALALVILIGGLWIDVFPGYRGLQTAASAFAMFMAGYTLFLGPQLARQDFRSDLLNTDILKTYPLRGWQVMLGEILTPVAILSSILWLALLILLLTVHFHQLGWLTPSLRLVIGLGLVPVVPVLCALQLLVPNAAALLFPSWAQTMRNRSERGIEMLGQRLIFIAGQFVVIVLALLPAAGGAALFIFITQHWIGLPAAVAVAAGGVVACLAAEVWGGLWLLGERFEKFDLSAELRP